MDPILLEFNSEITTERLFLRMPLPGDGKVVHKAIMSSIAELKDWLPFARNDQSLEETEVNIREAHVNFLKRKDMRLLIFHQDTGQFIGSTGLHSPDWRIPKFEIGYWIDSRFSGHGYMTEAVAGISDFAFSTLNARRLEIRCDKLNKKSRAIPEKLGFRLEGILVNEDLSVCGSQLRDTCIYSKTM